MDFVSSITAKANKAVLTIKVFVLATTLVIDIPYISFEVTTRGNVHALLFPGMRN